MRAHATRAAVFANDADLYACDAAAGAGGAVAVGCGVIKGRDLAGLRPIRVQVEAFAESWQRHFGVFFQEVLL